MAITETLLPTTHDGQAFESYVASPEGHEPKPAVILFHAWMGRMEYDDATAKRIAELGYIGVSADIYGVGKRGSSLQENQALMTPLANNRFYLQERLKTILQSVKDLPNVDTQNVVVAGFCFGGLCALDLARIGADIKGAAAFHAVFAAPDNIGENKIDAKIIAFHGYSDPMSTPENLVAFGAEMDAAEADWQVHAYGGVTHAFTNPHADDTENGLMYNKRAADRSWQSFTNFLMEVLPLQEKV